MFILFLISVIAFAVVLIIVLNSVCCRVVVSILRWGYIMLSTNFKIFFFERVFLNFFVFGFLGLGSVLEMGVILIGSFSEVLVLFCELLLVGVVAHAIVVSTSSSTVLVLFTGEMVFMRFGNTGRVHSLVCSAVSPEPVKHKFMLVVFELYQTLVMVSIGQVFELLL